MKKVYAEIGFGNKRFLSTEFEDSKKEYRISKFVKPKNIEDIYIRIWLFKLNIILSSRDGLKLKRKEKIKFKFLFGIGGYN